MDWLTDEGLDLKDVFQHHNERENHYSSYRQELDPRFHQTTWCADRAIEFIQEERQSPWLMSVNVFDPHPAFDAPDEYSKRYDPESLPPPLFSDSDLDVQERLEKFFFQGKAKQPGKQQQINIASYYGMIELIDDQLGRLLDTLEETNQRENTVVIFHSDHGEMLGDHGLTAKGCRFYEGLVRVPLIISWPGNLCKGIIADGLVELTDIAPTIAELTGISLEWTHGLSLMPILTGQASPDSHREFVRCEYYDTVNMYAPFEPEKHRPCWATMYYDGRYKLSVYHGMEYGELYDLENGPHEFENLWENRSAEGIKNELIKRSFDTSIIISDPGPPMIGRY
jgi:arylsulfatase A-like enzyme